MTIKMFMLFISLIIFSSCFFSKTVKEDEIILLSEELLKEFQINKKAASKKYKNKLFQINGEIFEISRPDHKSRKDESSCITLREKNCSFIFYFDYDVTKQITLKAGDNMVVQGLFKNFSKRIITEYNYEKKIANEKYWEEVERLFFMFKRSKIVMSTN